MKKKEIENHPLLAPLSLNDREEIWHEFGAKHPNWRWNITFFILWVLWASTFLIITQVAEVYAEGLGGKLLIYSVLFFGFGVIGGVILIGSFMLPKRRRDFYEYLKGKTIEQIEKDLDLSLTKEK